MTGRDISAVAARWMKDRLWVWRKVKNVNEKGITEEVSRLIYEDVPCFIRSNGVTGMGRRTVAVPDAFADVPDVRRGFAVYTKADVVLEDNDEVCVMRMGGEIRGNAAKSVVYPSHAETIIRVQERA